MSALHAPPLSEHASLNYTVDEIIQRVALLHKQAGAKYRCVHACLFTAEELAYPGYAKWGNRSKANPLGYPVADPNLQNPLFRRDNTLRALTRWQSWCLGRGFRARKFSESWLDNQQNDNKPLASDGLVTRLFKGLRRRVIKSVLATSFNIDRSQLKARKSAHDQGLSEARRSFNRAMKERIINFPRLRDMKQTRDMCASALETLEALKGQGIATLSVDAKAGFRPLLVGHVRSFNLQLPQIAALARFLDSEAQKAGIPAHKEPTPTSATSSETLNPMIPLRRYMALRPATLRQ